MVTTSNKSAEPERKQTDESLRNEREKTDQVIIGAKKKLEKEADIVIKHARENADAVLTTAREKADEKILHSGADSAPSTSIVKKRLLEDEVLQDERDLADKNILKEREKINHALRRLIPLDRQATDKTLLTERARLDTALENRDDFLGMVCHDLRSLLCGIMLTTELLAKQSGDHGGKEDASESVTQIQQYAVRMNRLIGDLLDIANIDLGKFGMMYAHKDAALLITEAVEAFQIIATEKDITLEVVGKPGSLFADFDYERILQVIANLLSNSIKFSARGSNITLYLEKKEGEIQFCVSDTGVGIPKDMLEVVFERFWQVGKNDRRGLGLGLYISKCIIELHGGKIWVESKIGEGSKFFFTLPKK